jgi:NADP-reducing hydrogenase subunit HndB
LQARQEKETVIFVGAGTCGLAAGATETLRALRDELAKRNIEAKIITVGCIGMCVKEPLVDIQRPGRPRITYANVKANMAPRLIEEHLVKGQIIQEWALGEMPLGW